MLVVKRNLIDRISDIEDFYKLLENIIEKEAVLLFPNEGDRRERFDLGLSAILKSNFALLLYNLIESTVTNCLVAIHSAISRENCKYTELSENIQHIFIDYYYKNLAANKISSDNITSHLQVMINTWAYDAIVQLSFDEYTKYKTGSTFSGNLDSKEINKLAKKYGVDFELKSSELEKIRNRRNKLAHGEVSFLECCNLDTLPYMKVLKDRTIHFLSEFTDSIEVFVNDKRFLR